MSQAEPAPGEAAATSPDPAPAPASEAAAAPASETAAASPPAEDGGGAAATATAATAADGAAAAAATTTTAPADAAAPAEAAPAAADDDTDAAATALQAALRGRQARIMAANERAKLLALHADEDGALIGAAMVNSSAFDSKLGSSSVELATALESGDAALIAAAEGRIAEEALLREGGEEAQKGMAIVRIQSCFRGNRARVDVADKVGKLQDELRGEWEVLVDPKDGSTLYKHKTGRTTKHKPQALVDAEKSEFLTAVVKIQAAYRRRGARDEAGRIEAELFAADVLRRAFPHARGGTAARNYVQFSERQTRRLKVHKKALQACAERHEAVEAIAEVQENEDAAALLADLGDELTAARAAAVAMVREACKPGAAAATQFRRGSAVGKAEEKEGGHLGKQVEPFLRAVEKQLETLQPAAQRVCAAMVEVHKSRLATAAGRLVRGPSRELAGCEGPDGMMACRAGGRAMEVSSVAACRPEQCFLILLLTHD